MKYIKHIFSVLTVLSIFIFSSAFSNYQKASLKLALLKYSGGGDWYANPTALPNLSKFCNDNLGTSFDADYATVEVGSADLFNYPFVHMTGHGNVVFSDGEADNLRTYLLGGGFLHIDDNYGMDPYVRPALKKVFPELEFVELPFEHDIYRQQFEFAKGLPKIHEHDGKPPQGFGLIWEDRIVCFYTYECDLGDGWEDSAVHNNPPDKRSAALKMGANIIQFAFQQ
ncbi:MAG: DUF4159 domain-containing protein [Bacteroidota bacterium]